MVVCNKVYYKKLNQRENSRVINISITSNTGLTHGWPKGSLVSKLTFAKLNGSLNSSVLAQLLFLVAGIPNKATALAAKTNEFLVMRARLLANSSSSTEGSLLLSKTIATNISKPMKSQPLLVSKVMTSWLRVRYCYFLRAKDVSSKSPGQLHLDSTRRFTEVMFRSSPSHTNRFNR